MKKLCSLKVLVVSTGSCNSKTYEGLSIGQYLVEFIKKWDHWERNLWFRCLGTLKGKGVLSYTVHVTPSLAALPKDDLNMAAFTPKLKTFGEIFFRRLENTCEARSHCAYETKSTTIRSTCLKRGSHSRSSSKKSYLQRRAECFFCSAVGILRGLIATGPDRSWRCMRKAACN